VALLCLLEPLRLRPDNRREHRERVNVGIRRDQLAGCIGTNEERIIRSQFAAKLELGLG
jgi:hypothetical protein